MHRSAKPCTSAPGSSGDRVNSSDDAPDAAFRAAALLSAAAFLLGGGSGFPLADMAVQLAGIGALGVALAFAPTTGRDGTRRAGACAPLILLALLALLIALQLVPLPPELWRGLPGREALWRTAQAVGMAEVSRPISMDPEATVRSALSLLPAAGMFAATLLLGSRARERLPFVVLALTAAHLAAAALQAASGGTRFYLHPDGHREVAAGLFENRNHFGTLIAVAALFAAAAFRRRDGMAAGAGPFALAAVLVALGAGAVASQSRMGAGLFAVALLATPFVSGWARPRDGRHFAGLAAAALGVGALAFATLAASSPFAALTERLKRTWREGDVDRAGIWEDAAFGAGDLFPAGSGLGTFQPVFDVYERLSEVGTHRANHAHNDWLEMVFELGAGGAALAAAFLVWFAGRSWAAWRAGGDAPARAASVGIALVLIHSLVDYPLRTAAIAALFGMMCALLVPPEKIARRTQR